MKAHQAITAQEATGPVLISVVSSQVLANWLGVEHAVTRPSPALQASVMLSDIAQPPTCRQCRTFEYRSHVSSVI